MGRPRSSPRRRAGATAREEILDAAAQLFSEQGYAATSTRAIADAVGIKQASLYYHFPSKEQILFDLLLATVEPSLAMAEALQRNACRPAARLWALAAYDVRVLCSGAWNLGALYLLPELRAERFEQFHRERTLLREAYRSIVAEGMTTGDFATELSGSTPGPEPADGATRLIFGLVESIISIRQESTELDPDVMAPAVADGCLRLLGLGARAVAAAHRDGSALLPATSPAPRHESAAETGLRRGTHPAERG